METKQLKSNQNPSLYKVIMVLVLVLSCSTMLNASRVITGTVSEAETSLPLIGATVTLIGTHSGSITDANGKYSITVPDKGAKLRFSYIGYETVEKQVKASNTIDVTMHASKVEIQEIIFMSDMCMEQSMPMMRSESKAAYNVAYAAGSPTYYNPSTEDYAKINENRFRLVGANPLSTLSIDVDRASYANVRRFIGQGQLPPADAVRIEELINYFDYDYPQPTNGHPFSVNTQYTDCPWQPGHKLLHIGLQGQKIPAENLPSSNLVFLIDVSGSMNSHNKLPLVKAAFKMLTNNLRETDRVAIVVYAGAAGLVLPSTKGTDKAKILDALDALQAGGSTAGSEGIALAYKVAKENYIDGGNNRVILATDGDFNVGISNNNDMERFIVEKRNDGIFLSCMGFGMGNYKDSKMEILANKGNGNYAYIDDMNEAYKVFVNEFGGTLFTIAKDVKIQIEFNPAQVQSYRLIGYEHRLLNDEDFKDDTKDAGELGAGHTVTALYEIIPVGVNSKFVPDVDGLKYSKSKTTSAQITEELATVKFRYKKPDGNKSIEMAHPIAAQVLDYNKASNNCRFAASVAMFGMLLTDSEFKGNASFSKVAEMANQAKGADKEGYRGEFVRLVNTASGLGTSAKK
jgi:Ca-activated chloride channel homolog